MKLVDLRHPASWWKRLPGGKARCELCPFNCILSEGKTGICRGKKNIGGELYAINYARTTSINLDPVEKKPLYHFHPGSQILSVGPNGCNLACSFCQNYHISQNEFPTRLLPPDEAVAIARTTGSVGIAYTYAEPLIWFEYVLDTSKAMREAGFKNVLVTNGVINPGPLEELLPWTDAMNIDIKSMDPEFYKKTCRGPLPAVLETVKRSAGKVHVEITNLVIPGLNDTDEMFEKLTDFMADINPFMPLHFSRYHPEYKLTSPPTPYGALVRAADIAGKKLKYVYVGNVPQEVYNQTKCHECGRVIISRAGFSVLEMHVSGGMCVFCGADAHVVTD
ncbi:MAG: AmmeMemoRadiSam system radical SAM enzyme [Nitrospinae bacterium]|nr:AmmeMemoRadiSam system radical SAM enzyme [Nitrospinota bacterium]